MLSVLVIEDSDEDFFLINKAFQASSFASSLSRVSSGDEALEFLASTEVLSKRVNLIFLDLNLPGFDGKYILKKLKNSDRLKKIPVVILTTSGNTSDINYCYSNGANTYIKKPADYKGFKDFAFTIKKYWRDITLLPAEV